MPTYEYKCRDCGETLEVVQSFTDDPLTECPACEGSLKKVFAAPGISFKGGGFYKTDSRSGSSTSAGASTAANGESSSGSDSSSKDSSTEKSSSKDSSSTASKDKASTSDTKASTSS